MVGEHVHLSCLSRSKDSKKECSEFTHVCLCSPPNSLMRLFSTAKNSSQLVAFCIFTCILQSTAMGTMGFPMHVARRIEGCVTLPARHSSQLVAFCVFTCILQDSMAMGTMVSSVHVAR